MSMGDGETVGWCQDEKTSVRCDSITGGYKVVPCTGQTYCTDGICRGPVCDLGSVCASEVSAFLVNGNGPIGTSPAPKIYDCTDGVNMIISECAGGEICWQNADKAECKKPDCIEGQSVCGNPRTATRIRPSSLAFAEEVLGLFDFARMAGNRMQGQSRVRSDRGR